MLGTYHTTALFEALAELHAIHTEEKLYAFVLNRASDVLKAQGGTYFTIDEAKAELHPQAAKGVSLSLLREVPFKMKLGVAGWCATNRQSVRIDGVQNDERFNRAVDVITGIRTRSILCVPVMRKDKAYGIIELVNRVDGIFHEADQEFLQFLARHVAVAIENCRTHTELVKDLGYGAGLMASATSGIIATDLQGKVSICNLSACRILGVNAEEVLGRPLGQALPLYPALVSALESTQKRQTPAVRVQLRFPKPNGETLVLGCSSFVIRESDHHLGIGVVFQDITSFVQPA